MYSLISQNQAIYSLKLEDAEIVMLSKENQEFLYAEILNWNAFQNLTEIPLATTKRLMDNLSLSEERLKI
jgi:hypothetical protein